MAGRWSIDRITRRLSALGLGAMHACLEKAEPAFVSAAAPPRWPPMFIIGPPRVGSTLVYQLIVSRFETAFFCNAAAAMPRCPALVTSLAARLRGITPPDRFDSRYGVCSGWSGPAQGRDIWGRWFPQDQSYVDAGGCSIAVMASIRGTVARIEQAMNSPFMNKAQGHCVRILPLVQAFPDALFVRVRRPTADVAESILLGRRECFGDDRQWFSAKPSSYPSLAHLDPLPQIVGQIRGLDADMDHDLARVGESRTIVLDYSTVCADPHTVLEEVARFYEDRSGFRLMPRRDVPARFETSTRMKVAAEESTVLRDMLASASNSN